MHDYPATPIMTRHARDRCLEMGISTKVAKTIIRKASVVRLCLDGAIAVSDEYPDYAVIYDPADIPVVISVVFRTMVQYERDGATYQEVLP